MSTVRKIKRELREHFKEDSDELFKCIWRKIVLYEKYGDFDDYYALYESLVSAEVNNPKSRFYITG